MVLARVGVLSAGKVLGIVYALLGFIVGGFVALVSMFGGAVNMAQNGNNAVPFAGAGVMAIVMLPIIYGILGFLGGIISAAIYNVVAGMVGGLEFELERAGTVGHPQ
jgi:hypothetical protein